MNFAALIDPDTLQPNYLVAKLTVDDHEYRVLEVTERHILVSVKRGSSIFAWELVPLFYDDTEVSSNKQVLVSSAKALKVHPYRCNIRQLSPGSPRTKPPMTQILRPIAFTVGKTYRLRNGDKATLRREAPHYFVFRYLGKTAIFYARILYTDKHGICNDGEVRGTNQRQYDIVGEA